MTPHEHATAHDASEVVQLAVPADPRYLSAVRLVAAALATDLDFTVDDIEELRMAVDEAVAVLISNASDDASIRVSFTITRRSQACLGVDGSVDGGMSTDAVDPLARRIVAAVVDRCTLNAGGFSLEKSSSLSRV